MKDFGVDKKFLGIEIQRDQKTEKLHKKILEYFSMK